MMDGLFIAIGQQGCGKTLMMIKHIVDQYQEDKSRHIYSNISSLTIPHTYFNFDMFIELISDMTPDLNNSIILVDEIHLYFDSLDFGKKENRKAQTFFSQLRKRNILVLATTQYLMNLDIRIRRQALFIFDMTKVIPGIFQCDVCRIDGYLTYPYKREYFQLDSYYKYYDTNEIITLN